MNIEKLPQSCKPKPVVGEKRDGSLTLRFDGDVDFDRVKRREDFIPHAISKTARWNAKQGSVGKINLLELTGISQIDSIQDLEPQAKSDLKLEEISFAGTVTLGGGEEAASLTFWSIAGSPEIPRIGLYTFSPVAKRNVVAVFQRDPKRVERFLKTFSRLEKHFGVARLQESFYLASENQSREVISQSAASGGQGYKTPLGSFLW